MVFQTFPTSHKDHPLLCHGFFNVRVSRLTVELRFHTRQERPLFFRDSQSFKGLLYVIWHLIPRTLWLCPFRQIVTKVIKMDALQIFTGPVGWERLFLKNFQRFLSKLTNPVRILFCVTNVIDRLLRQSCSRIKGVILRIGKVSLILINLQVWFF